MPVIAWRYWQNTTARDRKETTRMRTVANVSGIHNISGMGGDYSGTYRAGNRTADSRQQTADPAARSLSAVRYLLSAVRYLLSEEERMQDPNYQPVSCDMHDR